MEALHDVKEQWTMSIVRICLNKLSQYKEALLTQLNLRDVCALKPVLVLLGCGSTYVIYRNRGYLIIMRERYGPSINTYLIGLFSARRSADFRSIFKTSSLDTTKPKLTNHSHPEAASNRTQANMHMLHFINMIGREQFSVSMSKTEMQNATRGQRLYYHSKDLQMVSKNDKLLNEHVITMTDVDYYADMPKYMTGNHILLYTFTPQCTAGKTIDGIYSTDGNEITLLVKGGACYKHQLWDYDSDHLVVDHWWGSSFYLVESINYHSDRRLIFLNHLVNVYGPIAWLIPGKRFTRRELSTQNVPFQRYVKTMTNGESECFYSISKPGEFVSANITAEAFSSALTRLNHTKEPHLSDVERIFNTYKVENAILASTIFFDTFIRSKGVLTSLPAINTSGTDKHSYQSVEGPLVTEDGKPSMRAIWPGYMSTAFAPVKSLNNDHACLKGRVDEPKNLRKPIPPTFFKFMKEFVEMLVPNSMVHTLAPEDFDFMYDKFDRPSQRQQIKQIENTMIIDRVYVKSFQKAEAYGKVTAPRNISTLPMDHNLTLGQFMYPFMNAILKNTHWYAFGAHPNITSRRLVDKAQGKSFVIETDANKLDGSIQEIFRDVLVAAFTRAFHEQYAEEIIKLERKERYVKAKTAHGVSYNTDATILSGSIITSVLGSITNAFINYCALRINLTAKLAWDNMGLYGGDDGVTFDLQPDNLKLTAARFGMAFDAEIIPAGSPVMFLGRCYIDPWTTPQSFADVKRQIRKLHLSATPTIVSRELVLYRKATGILCTDSNTPLLTEWAKAVRRIVGNVENHKHYHLTKVDQSYMSQFLLFDAPTDVDLMRKIVAEKLLLTTGELVKIEKQFQDARTLDELLKVNIIRDTPEIQIPAVIAGSVVRPTKQRKLIPEIVKDNSKLKPIRTCKFGSKCDSKRCRYSHPK